MACTLCDGTMDDHILYRNGAIVVALATDPVSSGHIQVFTKNHYTILEEVPSEELQYLSNAVNKISMLLFEILKVHGTNIIIQNGGASGQRIPHVSAHIIPRRTDDGLKLDWELKKANNEDLESMQRIIAERMEQSNQQTNASPRSSSANAPVSIPVSETNNTLVIAQPEKSTTAVPVSSSTTGQNIVDASFKETGEKQITDAPHETKKKFNYYVKGLERIP